MSMWSVERAVSPMTMMRPGPRRMMSGDTETVTADSMEVVGGCLVFKDATGAVTQAFGPGGWNSVMPSTGPSASNGNGAGNGAAGNGGGNGNPKPPGNPNA